MARHTLEHPQHGEVVVEHDPSTGATTVEFERLESEDTIIPQYRMALTSEHTAAWVQWLLTHRYGRRCSLHSRWCAEADRGRGRLRAMLRQTERDAGAAHCMPAGAHVVLIRGGRVLKVGLRLDVTMDEFGRLLKEEEATPADPRPAAMGFVDFVHGLTQ